VPPKIQSFLWLLSHNKLATVDNLTKRGYKNQFNASFAMKQRALCIFSLSVVAKTIWEGVSAHLSFGIDSDYLSIASKWLHKGKF
jgi:hypothetical protein